MGKAHSLQATKGSPSGLSPTSSPQIWHTCPFCWFSGFGCKQKKKNSK